MSRMRIRHRLLARHRVAGMRFGSRRHRLPGVGVRRARLRGRRDVPGVRVGRRLTPAGPRKARLGRRRLMGGMRIGPLGERRCRGAAAVTLRRAKRITRHLHPTAAL